MGWLFKISLALIALGFFAFFLVFVTPMGGLFAMLGLLSWASAAALLIGGFLRMLFHRLLWGVGRRLLVSYLLIGVVPIPLLLALTYMLVYVLSGQLATRRVEAEIDRGLLVMQTLASQMAGSGPGLPDYRDSGDFELPEIGWAFLPVDAGPAVGEGPLSAAELLPRDRVHTSVTAVGRIKEGPHFIAASVTGEVGTALVYTQVDPYLRLWLQDRTSIGVSFPRVEMNTEDDNFSLTLDQGEDGLELSPKISGDSRDGDDDSNDQTEGGGERRGSRNLSIDRPDPTGGGWRDAPMVYWLRSVQLPYIYWSAADWHAAVEGMDRQFAFVIRSSIDREYLELYSTLSADKMNAKIARSARIALVGLATFTLVLYLVAALLAAVLVYRIAHATHRLGKGFAAIERGDFEHRAALQGRDQLSGLVDSFNGMVDHLQSAVAERAEKKALDRELQLAQELQRSLLPSADISFPGFEVATDFQPAAAIGGDFYHFIEKRDGSLAVVIADVSGHGLATGIVMSAAKTLLSALASEEDQSAVEMLQRLDHELLQITDPRTFVTLAHCLLDSQQRCLEFTNAGHVYPYRLTAAGELHQPSNPSRPLGLTLPANFRTENSALEPGDLVVLISDGIIETMCCDGSLFGFERFEASLGECAGRSAADTLEHLLSVWQQATGVEQSTDDRTLIVVKHTGTDTPEPEEE